MMGSGEVERRGRRRMRRGRRAAGGGMGVGI